MATQQVFIEAHLAPQAGMADPSAVLEPAHAEDIEMRHQVAFDEIRLISRAIDDVMVELAADATNVVQAEDALVGRVEDELIPLLFKMRTLLPHGQWIPWYKAFRTRYKKVAGLRQVQRGFRKLKGLDSKKKKPEKAADIPEAIALADAERELGQSAAQGNLQAKAIIAECRAAYEAAKARKGAEHPPIGRERLASIIETAERYVLALERMVCSAYTEEQMKHLQKPREAWRKILRDDARGFRWPDEEEAA